MLISDAKNAFKFQLFTLRCLYENWPEGMERWKGIAFDWKSIVQADGSMDIAANIILTISDGIVYGDVQIPLDEFRGSASFHAPAATLARKVVAKLTPRPRITAEQAAKAPTPEWAKDKWGGRNEKEVNALLYNTSRPPPPPIEFKRDGDQWCATWENDFVNLQESPAGFGATKELAEADLMMQERPRQQPKETVPLQRRPHSSPPGP